MTDTSGTGGQGQGRRPRAARDLTEAEIQALIADNHMAVLATLGEGQPYAVPLIYGYADGAFYSLLSPGHKVRNVERNPNVCVTIVQTWDTGKRWRSVVATGRASWLSDEDQLATALAAIRRQHPGMPVPDGTGAAALRGCHVLRVDVAELTGRGND